MKFKLITLSLSITLSMGVYANDFFTVNTGSAKNNESHATAVISKENEHDFSPQSPDFISASVANSRMTLYNFEINQKQTFLFGEIDSNVDYARKFIPPNEEVLDVFDHFVNEGASPGIALLLTYRKLDEAINSLNENDSSAN